MADGGTALAVLTVAAGLALLVERIIEALKHLIDGAVTDDAGARRRASGSATDSRADVPQAPAAEFDAPDGPAEPTFERIAVVGLRRLEPVTDADFALAHRRLFYLVAALGLGIGITTLMPVGMLGALFGGEWSTPGSRHAFTDRILTGIVIAGGSQPIHVLLRFLSTRSVPGTATEVAQPAVTPSSPPDESTAGAVLTANFAPGPAARSGWVRIPYRGGVRPQSLEGRNFRSAEPELVVYHHTGMPSSTGFDAVVDEFLINKGWSTGYHCVILPDGKIRPFCRWDRRGNHTRGLNDLSLGVAFHGNFHADPGDIYSNHDGRYGNLVPTRQQLESGARLIALWVMLYEDIELDFGRSILAHRAARPGHTVCPGSRFPQTELETLVTGFVEDWRDEPAVIAELEAFRHQAYLFAHRPMRRTA